MPVPRRDSMNLSRSQGIESNTIRTSLNEASRGHTTSRRATRLGCPARRRLNLTSRRMRRTMGSDWNTASTRLMATGRPVRTSMADMTQP